jgi:nucleoside-diphosphate-sugar epimerase
MTTKKTKILITGGLGFIGHNLSIELKAHGFDVVIVDNYSHNISKPWHEVVIQQRLDLVEEAGIQIVKADTTVEPEIESVLLDAAPDKIIHTAAIPDARLSNKDPSAAFDQNLLATKHLLEIMRRNDMKVQQFTYLSSSMVYGDFKTSTVEEDAPKDPKGVYGAAKLSSELLIKAYHNVVGIPYTIVRPSALYGPRCINNRVTQVFIEKALRREPITIQGDGSQKLDFTFCPDFVDGMVVLQKEPHAINETFNLTTGHAEELGSLATILKKYFNDLEVQYTEWEKIIPKRGTLSIDKVKQIGFTPKHTLETGYPKYIEWYLENEKYFKIGETS